MEAVPTAFYNEIEPYAAEWLVNLAAAGHIASGRVDTRSIVELTADDVRDATQAHFFAGLGGWSHALRLAGWPDDVPVWTGSCPCQPFSAAGKRKGFDDDRHLWPVWFNLIRECRPPIIFGEQVASPEVVGHQGEGRGVSACLPPTPQSEGPNPSRQGQGGEKVLAVRSGRPRRVDTTADRPRVLRGNGVAAQPGWRAHLGQSLAGSDCPFCGLRVSEHPDRLPCCEQRDGGLGRAEDGRPGARGVGETAREVTRLVAGLGRCAAEESGGSWIDIVQADLESAGYAVGFAVLPAGGVGAPHIRQRLYFVGYASGTRLERRPSESRDDGAQRSTAERAERGGFWSDAAWVAGADGKARPTQPGLHPLAHGVPARVGRLRAYGNAIVPQVAATFIRSVMEVM